jgi:hypothetical protein
MWLGVGIGGVLLWRGDEPRGSIKGGKSLYCLSVLLGSHGVSYLII